MEIREKMEHISGALVALHNSATDVGSYFWNAFNGRSEAYEKIEAMRTEALRAAKIAAFRDFLPVTAEEYHEAVRNLWFASIRNLFLYGDEESRRNALGDFSLSDIKAFLGDIPADFCGEFWIREHYSPELGESIAFIIDVEDEEDEEGNIPTFEWAVAYVSLRDFSKWEFPTDIVTQETIDKRKSITDKVRKFRNIFAVYGTTEEEFLASHPRITSDDPRSLEQVVEDSCKEFEAYRNKIAEEYFPYGY